MVRDYLKPRHARGFSLLLPPSLRERHHCVHARRLVTTRREAPRYAAGGGGGGFGGLGVGGFGGLSGSMKRPIRFGHARREGPPLELFVAILGGSRCLESAVMSTP